MILGDASTDDDMHQKEIGRRTVRAGGGAGTSSDAALIERIADRDQLAMRTLFARHRVVCVSLASAAGKDNAIAEDLLSDVFLDVWRQAATFEGQSSVSTWLLAIARNKAISARRRRRT